MCADVMVGAADAMLNLESSLTNEMEAEMLIGRNLNLDKMRQAAFTGDMVTIMKDTGGSFTIIQGSNFSLINSADASTGTRTLAQRGLATILFNAQNQGYISGSGLS